jgi:hypothetical protein
MRGESEKRVKARLSLSLHVHELIDQTRSLQIAVNDAGQRGLCCVVSILLFQSRVTELSIVTSIVEVSCGNFFCIWSS